MSAPEVSAAIIFSALRFFPEKMSVAFNGVNSEFYVCSKMTSMRDTMSHNEYVLEN